MQTRLASLRLPLHPTLKQPVLCRLLHKLRRTAQCFCRKFNIVVLSRGKKLVVLKLLCVSNNTVANFQLFTCSGLSLQLIYKHDPPTRVYVNRQYSHSIEIRPLLLICSPSIACRYTGTLAMQRHIFLFCATFGYLTCGGHIFA